MKIFDKDASGAIDIEEFYDVLVKHHSTWDIDAFPIQR
jgi:Ca2+-binding EF-hand superfamily protein